MPTQRETGKDRWKRVPKDYFKTPDRLQRAKLRFSALAFVLAIGWCALGMDWGGKSGSATPGLDLRANHGELAKVHAAWDNKCEACHSPFQPINGRPWLSSTSTAASRKDSDKLCLNCHAGPAHHDTVVESAVRSCAECHRDHRGREASLVKLDDLECTRCHSSLKDFINPSAKPAGSRDYAGNINRFDLDHPPFRPETAVVSGDGKSMKDRGALKFNHALHMTRGIVPKTGDTPYTVGKIPVASERSRYGKSESEPVQLDCASCHSLEASSPKAPATPPPPGYTEPVRSDAKYYQPVRYEAQCAACHDLSFDLRSPEIRAPHGVQPPAVVDFLKRTYASQLFDEKPALLETFVPASGLPGKSGVAADARQSFERSRATAEQILFGEDRQSCHECHTSTKVEGQFVPKSITPTNVPTVWFTHANFDHSAHRGVSCRDCHAKSYAVEADGTTPVVGASRTSADVLVPGIENCRECHSPAKSEGGWAPWSASSKTTGGVAFGCTECHSYHNDEHAREGLGARAGDSSRERTIAQFLLGKEGGAPAPPSKPAGP